MFSLYFELFDRKIYSSPSLIFCLCSVLFLFWIFSQSCRCEEGDCVVHLWDWRSFLRRPNNAPDIVPLSFFYNKSQWNHTWLEWFQLELKLSNVPRIIMTSPVLLVVVGAVTIVQKVVVNETFGRPWRSHKCQIRCAWLVENYFFTLHSGLVHVRISFNLECHIFRWLWEKKKKMTRLISCTKLSFLFESNYRKKLFNGSNVWINFFARIY